MNSDGAPRGALRAALGAKVDHVLYWYPGPLDEAYEADVREQHEPGAEVHTAHLGVVLSIGGAVLSFSWRMDGSEEWLALGPPWFSNDALPEYLVVNATGAWRARGLIGAALTDARLVTDRGGNPERRKDLVGVSLCIGGEAVSVALAEFYGAELGGAADTVATVFSPSVFGALVERSGWEQHPI